MPFRDVTLPTGEVVHTRVTDEAITDWLRDRPWLRQHDRPDRPPDWDDGPTRGWLPHVSTERASMHYWKGVLRQTSGITPETAVAECNAVTYIWDTGGMMAKLIVTERGDGSFRYRHRAYTKAAVTIGATTLPPGHVLNDDEALTAPDVPADHVGDHIEYMLTVIDALMCAVAGDDIVPSMRIGEPDDYTELDQARLEVAAEYGWAPWAETLLGPNPAKPLDSMPSRA